MEGYDEIRKMTLFAGKVLLSLHYYPKLFLEVINPFSRPTVSNSVLLIASKEYLSNCTNWSSLFDMVNY